MSDKSRPELIDEAQSLGLAGSYVESVLKAGGDEGLSALIEKTKAGKLSLTPGSTYAAPAAAAPETAGQAPPAIVAATPPVASPAIVADANSEQSQAGPKDSRSGDDRS